MKSKTMRMAGVATMLLAMLPAASVQAVDYYDPTPFGVDTKRATKSDKLAVGQWWKLEWQKPRGDSCNTDWFKSIPRDQALAFALYTHHNGVLKISGQCQFIQALGPYWNSYQDHLHTPEYHPLR